MNLFTAVYVRWKIEKHSCNIKIKMRLNSVRDIWKLFLKYTYVYALKLQWIVWFSYVKQTYSRFGYKYMMWCGGSDTKAKTFCWFKMYFKNKIP